MNITCLLICHNPNSWKLGLLYNHNKSVQTRGYCRMNNGVLNRVGISHASVQPSQPIDLLSRQICYSINSSKPSKPSRIQTWNFSSTPSWSDKRHDRLHGAMENEPLLNPRGLATPPERTTRFSNRIKRWMVELREHASMRRCCSARKRRGVLNSLLTSSLLYRLLDWLGGCNVGSSSA